MGARARIILGRRIRELRTALALSQEELADRAGLHRTYVGAVERGERNVSIDNILAIARALGVSGSELLRGVG
jgi:transcriptional regulator with XRE-family HTH domain